jgi:DNA-binding response OmpR family regulator
VVIVADDLMWAERLASLVRSVGGQPAPVGSLDELATRLDGADAAIVDLTARRYDGVAAVARAAAARVRVIAVGRHDDHALRRRALDAGAERVLAYRKLADDGPATIARWLGRGVRTQ